MSEPKNPRLDHLLELARTAKLEAADGMLAGIDDDDPAEAETAWAAEIDRRVAEIRNGAAKSRAEDEVLAELEGLDAAWAGHPLDDPADAEDAAEVELAWEEEIERRLHEIRSGTANTYAAEDVLVALRLRFG
jgi:hypothetical protein